MRALTCLLAALFLSGLGLKAEAQNPGQGISVDIQIGSVTIRGDTIGVTSQVRNLGSSRDSLLTYLVDSPSGVTQIQTPSPGDYWDTMRAFRGRPMAGWTNGTTLSPGAVWPDLHFEAIGLPAIVSYWAKGDFEPPDLVDGPDSVVRKDPLAREMITGKTVGVNPWPIDRTPGALLSRLRGLTQSTCNAPTLWITDSNLCNQLTSYLDQAEAFRSNGQAPEARSALDSFKGLLSAPNGTIAAGVSSSAYWLLVSNADIVRSML